MCLFHADIINLNGLNKTLKYVHIYINLAKKSWSWKFVIFHTRTVAQRLCVSSPWRSGSNRLKTLNERFKKLASSAINIVYLLTLSGVEKQISAHKLLLVLPVPFMLNRMVTSALGQ